MRHYVKLKGEQADVFPSLHSHVILYKQYIWKFVSECFAFPVGKCERKFSVENKKQVNVCQFTLEEMQGFMSEQDWNSSTIVISVHEH